MRYLLLPLLGFMLSSCSRMLDRIENIGNPPPLAPIQNPVEEPNYKPVTVPLDPRDQPQHVANPGSLWQPNSRSFFKDQRASRVGDIITIKIELNDNANLSNTTDATRNSTMDSTITNLFGLEKKVGQVLKKNPFTGKLLDTESKSELAGEGSIVRSEKINLKVAALVTQVLPNGNLVVNGKQQVSVNFEARDLYVTGIVRPQDILADNTIEFAKIAEARLAYGGRGNLTEAQQAPYGQQLVEIISPF